MTATHTGSLNVAGGTGLAVPLRPVVHSTEPKRSSAPPFLQRTREELAHLDGTVLPATTTRTIRRGTMVVQTSKKRATRTSRTDAATRIATRTTRTVARSGSTLGSDREGGGRYVPPRGITKLSAEQKAEIVRRYRRGDAASSMKRIAADVLGTKSQKVVRDVLEEAGETIRPKGHNATSRVFTAGELEQMRHAYEQEQASTYDLAARFRTDRSRVSAELLALGVALRAQGGRGQKVTTLTETQRQTIRDRVAAGEKRVDMAREYGVTPNTITRITEGVT